MLSGQQNFRSEITRNRNPTRSSALTTAVLYKYYRYREPKFPRDPTNVVLSSDDTIKYVNILAHWYLKWKNTMIADKFDSLLLYGKNSTSSYINPR